LNLFNIEASSIFQFIRRVLTSPIPPDPEKPDPIIEDWRSSSFKIRPDGSRLDRSLENTTEYKDIAGSVPKIVDPFLSKATTVEAENILMQKFDQPEQNFNLEVPVNPVLPSASWDYKPNSNAEFPMNPSLLSTSSNETPPENKNSSDLQWVSATAREIRLAADADALFGTTVTEVRQYLKADRVLIYGFQSEAKGLVLAESMMNGYTPTLGETLPPIAFGADNLLDYQQQPAVCLNNIDQQALRPYHRQLLEQFQIKASLSLPILVQNKLWGLLVVQQCSQSRKWQDTEIILLYQIVNELKLRLQGLDFHIERQALARVSEKIHQNSNIETIFQIVSQETRNLLKVERVAICQFRPDYFGDFVFESKEGELPSIMGIAWEDTYIRETQGGGFRNNKPFISDDISKTSLSDCFRTIEGLEIRACAIAPIFREQTLWGVLCAYQHSASLHWQASEVQLLQQMSTQLGVALQQTTLLEERDKSTQYKQELPTLIGKMNNASSFERTCQAAVQEVRQMLDVERVAIYKFRPDYFGDFVYESESGGFPNLVGSAWEDTYIQEHQGGRFRNNEPYLADNIYAARLSECHVKTLEHFGVKSYLIVAIKQGEKLWGLLSAFQHSGSRHWLDSDVTLLSEIGRQLGLSLQSTDYLTQLEEQFTQTSKTAQISRTVSEIIPKILQAQDLETTARVTNQSVRNLLKCDRVALYRCLPDGSSEWVAESATQNQQALNRFDVSALWVKRGLQEPRESPYHHLKSLVVNNSHTAGYSPEEVEKLEELEVNAYVITPIFKENHLWGWLVANENEKPRSWTEAEIAALNQICTQLGTAMERVSYLEQIQQTTNQLVKTTEQERLITRIGERIRQSLNLQQVFKQTVREIRSFLKTDRVIVFKFDPSSGYDDGEVIAEDVRAGFASTIAAKIHDPCFSERSAELYQKGRVWAVSDIYEADLADCYLELLAQFQVRGQMIVPLMKGEDLWGLFGIYQCNGPREWQESEVEFARRIAAQLNVAIQQGEYLEQMQQQSQQIAEAAQRDKAAKEQLQQEVIQLLIAVRPALEGDLTVRAPITESEVGTIADAYNNTLGSLRQIVTQMQTAAQQVVQTSTTSDASIGALATQAQQQLQALNRALEQVQTLLHATEAVEANAQQVEVAVQMANQTVQEGDAAIERTVDEILNIRETVAETNKRLKRLSESSQKITRVLSVIGSFTNQTQLLALNASIEATRAGEYGRGFAVVADEVRSLARQSAGATTEIEQLVQEIQMGTAEVSTAMETSITQVAAGTDQVAEARQHLNEIVAATDRISQLVVGITQSTQAQTQQFHAVTATMTEVAAIANQTSEDSATMSTSFKELLEMAQNLQEKGAQFRVN
jgi:methyl-accepting chemotaxis protein PixJ